MPYLRFSTEIDPDEIGAAGEIGETKVGETEAEETEAERLHKVHQARNRHKEFLETHRDDIVHGSRTLDEFYYQHLLKSGNGHEPADESSKEKQEDENRQQKQDRFAKDLENRNMNQVTSRYFYGDKIKNGGHWDILRVDQLWMWIIDDGKTFALVYTCLWVDPTDSPSFSRDDRYVVHPFR